ncbi:MAG: hypothetical protein ACXADY_23240 [Candidatus Hodarchaeales archaeon]|jgi:hypothetical protein
MTLEKNSYTQNKISFDIPTYMDFLPPLNIKKLDLNPTEQKLYLQLSLEFQIVLDNTPSFQMGAYKWYQMLPERLQVYGLTNEEWERISNLGDSCGEIQDQLNELIEKMEKIS